MQKLIEKYDQGTWYPRCCRIKSESWQAPKLPKVVQKTQSQKLNCQASPTTEQLTRATEAYEGKPKPTRPTLNA